MTADASGAFGRGRLIAAVGTAAAACAATVCLAAAFRRQAQARGAAAGAVPADGAIRASGSVVVSGTPEDAYARWRDLPRLPSVLSHLREVRVLDQQRSRWTAVAPDSTRVTWDAELTEEIPGRELAWRSLPPAPWPTEGRVRFAPARGGRGTTVRLDLTYAASRNGAGPVPFEAARDEQIRRDLERFKQSLAGSGRR